MSDTFDGFGEAARLYATYAAVVDDIRERYQAEVAAFADAVRDRVRDHVQSGKLKEVAAAKNPKTRTWWIRDGTDEDEQFSYVWFYALEAALIFPGKLRLLVCTYRQNEPRRLQVASLQQVLKLPGHCQILKGEAGSVFTVEITYGDADPVTATVEPILHLLTQLYEIDLKTKRNPEA